MPSIGQIYFLHNYIWNSYTENDPSLLDVFDLLTELQLSG